MSPMVDNKKKYDFDDIKIICLFVVSHVLIKFFIRIVFRVEKDLIYIHFYKPYFFIVFFTSLLTFSK